MKFLLRLYPRAWRERYGEEFSDLLEASPANWHTVVDTARGAADARRREGGFTMRRLIPAVLLVVVMAVIGWLNYHASDDVQPVAAALLLAGFGFTFWRPRLIWLFIPLLWVAVPASSIVGYAANYHPGIPKPAPLYETLVALIPTALGAAIGAGAALLTGRAGKGDLKTTG
jgi:hypothetical protein